MNEKHALHSEILASPKAGEYLREGTFFFVGGGGTVSQLYKKTREGFTEIPIVRPDVSSPELDKVLDNWLKDFPPAVQLFILEKLYRDIHVFLDGEQVRNNYINALKSKFRKIFQVHTDALLVADIIKISSILGDDEEAKAQNLKILHPYNLKLKLEVDLKVPNDVKMEEIVADLRYYPKHIDYFMGAGSQYRKMVANSPQTIREIISAATPVALHDMRKTGVIDAVLFPWRRNALYRALERAEQTSPTRYIFLRYFEAPEDSFYARRRKAQYKADMDQLPIDFKINFIIEHPEYLNYFFDKKLVEDLKSRLDLFFKLLQSHSGPLMLKLFHSRSDIGVNGLFSAAVEICDKEERQLLLNRLVGYEANHTMEEVRDEDRELFSKNKSDKGKAEEAVESSEVKCKYGNVVAKVEINALSAIPDVLAQHKDFRDLEVFLPFGVLILQVVPENETINVRFYCTLENQSKETSVFRVREYFPGSTFKPIFIETLKLRQAIKLKISPDDLSELPPRLGLFARIRAWWNSRKVNRAVVPVIAETSVDRQSSSEIDTESIPSDSAEGRSPESKAKVKKTSSAVVFHEGQLQEFIKEYEAIAELCREKNYKTAADAFHGMCKRLEEDYPAQKSEESFSEMEDDGSFLREVSVVSITEEDLLLALTEIVNRSAVTRLESLFMSELLKSLFSANPEFNKYMLTFSSSVTKLPKTSDEKPFDVPTKLALLEEKYRKYRFEKGSFRLRLLSDFASWFRIIRELQIEYLGVLRQADLTDPAIKALVLGSELLSFTTERDKISDARIEIMKIYADDPVFVLEQKFRLSSDPLVEITKGMELSGIVDYIIAHPEHAWSFLTDKELDLVPKIDATLLGKMIDQGTPKLLHFIQASGLLNSDEYQQRLRKKCLEILQHLIDEDNENHARGVLDENEFLPELLNQEEQMNLKATFEQKYPGLLSEFSYKSLDDSRHVSVLGKRG